MSLTHLGRFSEPVFDSVLPTRSGAFPVARRIVSHAARSLFAGKLLFPVPIPGKEGQHCFAANPSRLFRSSARRSQEPAALQPAISRISLVLPSIPAARIQSSPRLEMSKRALPPRPEIRTRTVPRPSRPDLGLAGSLTTPIIHSARFPDKEFRAPLYLQQPLISRFEKARLRRMAQPSDIAEIASPPGLLTPVSPAPEAWRWFAWPSRSGIVRPELRHRLVLHGSPVLPKPRLMTPQKSDMASLSGPTPGYTMRRPGPGSAWRPESRPKPWTVAFFALPRHHALVELIYEPASLAPLDRDLSISVHIVDSLRVFPHPAPGSFPSVHGRLRPGSLSWRSHPEASAGRLAPPPEKPTGLAEIIANIPKSRLAPIKGMPRKRMLPAWPRAVFRPLRQLLFRTPFAKRFDFPGPGPLEFHVAASRFFSSLRALPGSSGVSFPHPVVPSKAKPIDRRVRQAFDHSPKDRLLTPQIPAPPAARLIEFRLSAVQPPPVQFPCGLPRKGTRQTLRRPDKPVPPSKAGFSLKDRQITPFPSIVSGQGDLGGTTGLRFPEPPMLVLDQHPRPRGPRPASIPRRLAATGGPERMVCQMAALSRRSHSTRHYLLSLESSATWWKHLPHVRRPHLLSVREPFRPPALRPDQPVRLPASFSSASLRRESMFAVLGVRTVQPVLRGMNISPRERLYAGRSWLPPTQPQPPDSVAGARFLGAPDWLHHVRQPKMRVRYWPTYYGFPPPPPQDRMVLSEAARPSLPLPEPSRVPASPRGPFTLRRSERPRGPFSMRRPRRWLLRSDAAATGIPGSYYHENALPTTTPSRLAPAERFPPAFMGPAFRAPWHTIAHDVFNFRQTLLEAPAVPAPERMPHCRATTRPAAESAVGFQAVPMPRVITTARLPEFSPPAASIETSFGLQPFRPVGPVLPGFRSDRFETASRASALPVEAFVELRPEFLPGEFLEGSDNGLFLIRDLLCDLISRHGCHRARWRSLFFPYKPDVGRIESHQVAPFDPPPNTLMQRLLDSPAPLQPHPGLPFPVEDPEEVTLPAETVGLSYTPEHLGREQVTVVPVLSMDTYAFDILEAPASPAAEPDFTTAMFSPFLPAPVARSLDDATPCEPPRPVFSQAVPVGAPPVSWVEGPADSSGSPASLDHPSHHTVISAGRWSRRLPVRTWLRIFKTQPVEPAFVAAHALDLPALPASAFQALHIVDLAPAVLTVHETLKARDSQAARLRIPAPRPPRIDRNALRLSEAAEPAPRPVHASLIALRYRLHESSTPVGGRRITIARREIGFDFPRLDIIRAPGMHPLALTEKRVPARYRVSSPGRAAIHMPALPDWLELPSARPSCRPPTGL